MDEEMDVDEPAPAPALASSSPPPPAPPPPATAAAATPPTTPAPPPPETAAPVAEFTDAHCNAQAITPVAALLKSFQLDPTKYAVVLDGRRLNNKDAVFRPLWRFLQRQRRNGVAISNAGSSSQIQSQSQSQSQPQPQALQTQLVPAQVFRTLFHLQILPMELVPEGAGDEDDDDRAADPLPETMRALLHTAADLHARFPDTVAQPCAALVRHVQLQMGQLLMASTKAQPAWLDFLLLGDQVTVATPDSDSAIAAPQPSAAAAPTAVPWRYLLPFAVRRDYYVQHYLGYARCLIRLAPSASRMGNIMRQKVRLDRAKVLSAAGVLLNLFSHEYSLLEFQYRDEVGTGQGPTLEFYNLVVAAAEASFPTLWNSGAKPYLMPRGGAVSAQEWAAVQADHAHELTRREQRQRHADSAASALLQPPPTSAAHETATAKSVESGAAVLRVLGQLMAKAVLDDRVVDIPFHPRFLALVFDPRIDAADSGIPPATLADVADVDSALAKSLQSMLDTPDPAGLHVHFEFDGHDLIDNGSDVQVVTRADAQRYVSLVSDLVAGATGQQHAARAVRTGFEWVLPAGPFATLFTTAELAAIFSGSAAHDDEQWTRAALVDRGGLRADHGYSLGSRVVCDLVDWMCTLPATDRRAFLTFLTGAPRLPIGGWTKLNPPFTVVQRSAPAPDQFLPSVMTCANYLKMPMYSSRAILEERMRVAIGDGLGSFHLS
ncbi:hypothetical protein BC828DRAFT_376934 [Blastocladiella britannica]|nr:hypothetical protein BC828DRAFT_376934 [Blastocladiella britannica]